MLIGLVNLISTIIGLCILDRFGRRVLMILGSLVMAISLGVVAITINIPGSAYIAIAAILVYIFAFACSTGLVGWLITSEIFPLKVRGNGTAIAVTSFWIFNISVSFSFPILLKIVGLSFMFGFFSIICIISLFYCLIFLPETKGVSLETIEHNLINGVKSRHLGNQ